MFIVDKVEIADQDSLFTTRMPLNFEIACMIVYFGRHGINTPFSSRQLHKIARFSEKLPGTACVGTRHIYGRER